MKEKILPTIRRIEKHPIRSVSTNPVFPRTPSLVVFEQTFARIDSFYHRTLHHLRSGT